MAVDIIVAGHLTLDMIPDVQMLTPDNITDAGKLFEIGTMSMSTGGAVSNTGLALHHLGTSVGLIGLVGDDWIGHAILDFLRGHDPMLIEAIQSIPSASSAYTIVIEPQNHDRTLLTHTGANHRFGLDSLDLDVIHSAKLFHLGYPTLLPRLYQHHGDELVAIFQTVKHDLNCITSLDLTLPDANHASGQVDWRAILTRTLPHVDIFIPSIEEILFMLRRGDYERWRGNILPHMTSDYIHALADELLKMGSAIAGFKPGMQGIFVKTTGDLPRLAFLERIGQSPDAWRAKYTHHPAFKVDVAGTTGAGDAAYAGFLSALLRGLPIEDCAKMGCAVGACCVEMADPSSGVQSWDATRARINSGWLRHSLPT